MATRTGKLAALRKRKAELNARIAEAKAVEEDKARKEDTRVKVLISSAFVADTVKNPETRAEVVAVLERAIVAPKDREFLKSKGWLYNSAEHHVNDSRNEDHRDVCRSFVELWKRGAGFEVIKRSKGYSARYRSEPLLWVFPTYFQIAPQHSGNDHNREVRDLRDQHFREVTKGLVYFVSEHGNAR